MDDATNNTKRPQGAISCVLNVVQRYGKPSAATSLPPGTWVCECPRHHAPKVARCAGCGYHSPSVQASHAARPIEGAEHQDAGQSINPWPGRESALQAVCEAELSRLGVRVRFHLPPKVRAMKGYPDLTFVFRGVAFAIELKNEAGRLDAAQRECLRDMDADGWTVGVCRSLEDLRETMRKGVGG